VRNNDELIVEPDWIGTTEAAKYLGLRPPTLYRLIDDGLLPAYKAGRLIRIKVSDLDAFIDACQIEPGTLGHLYTGHDLDDVG
jgi:excisionase family DNA binding protein